MNEAEVVTSHPSFDIDKVRADFPALSMHVYGKPLVYLDNAASAQKPRQVIERMKTAYETEYANVHRGLHYLANAATDAFEAARESVRGFLNAGSVDEIIFTRSATEAINLVASSFGQQHIGAGDEIGETGTLALDVGAGAAGLSELLDRLDRMVVDAGGRIYLAKDSRLDPGLVRAMYPDLDRFTALRDRVDPDRHLQSDLGRRLGL